LFLLLPLVPNKLQLADNAVAAARAAGVRHIVRSSGAGADPASPISLARLQGSIDAKVAGSGLAHTFLRPSGFMQNWVTFAGAQIKAGKFHAPHGSGAQSLVDARDIADAAAAVLTNPEAHAGQAYTLTGAEALTDEQMLGLISQATGREVRYVDVPEAAALQALQGMGMPAVMVDWFMSLNEVVKQGWAAGVTGDVQRLTGHAPRRFADFVRENASAWR
jgi:NAD(P)H dehydrogenase (quinone)